MSEYLQILQMSQEVTTLVMGIVAINSGLILIVLIVGIINQIRTNRIMNRVLSRLQETSMEMMMEGTPVVLEDLIKRDLMEQNPRLNTPVTEDELIKIRQQMAQGMKKP